MIKNKQTFFSGGFILLTWLFFGIPSSWKIFFTICTALYLVISSIKITLPKQGIIKRTRRKEKVTPIFTENSPIYPKEEQKTEQKIEQKTEEKMEVPPDSPPTI